MTPVGKNGYVGAIVAIIFATLLSSQAAHLVFTNGREEANARIVARTNEHLQDVIGSILSHLH